MTTSGQQAVDAYIVAAPRPVQPMLRQLRQAIKSAVPKAEEKISYQMPFYAYQGGSSIAERVWESPDVFAGQEGRLDR